MNEIVEVEKNGSRQQSQSIDLNTTVNGVIDPEDVDVFKVVVEKGQRLSVEIEAIRLGFMFDPFIAILDEKDFEVAISDDSMQGDQDGVLSVVIPDDGSYFVHVRESSYGGNANCRYRLHVGGFPRPTVAFPTAGAPGQELDIRFLGDSSGEIVESVAVPESTGFRSGLFVSDVHGVSPSPVAFRLSGLSSHSESSPMKTVRNWTWLRQRRAHLTE